jgi:hypothetical protein
LPGFATSQGRLTLGSGESLDRDVALQIGEIQETLNRQRAAMAPRLYPRIPDGKFCCFYPMNRRRGESRPAAKSLAEHQLETVARPKSWCQAQRRRGPGQVEVPAPARGFLAGPGARAADPEFASAAVEALRLWQFRRCDWTASVEANIHVLVKFVAE